MEVRRGERSAPSLSKLFSLETDVARCAGYSAYHCLQEGFLCARGARVLADVSARRVSRLASSSFVAIYRIHKTAYHLPTIVEKTDIRTPEGA